MLRSFIKNWNYIIKVFIIAFIICLIWGLGEYAINSYINYKVGQEVQIKTETIRSNYENEIKSLEQEIRAKNYHIILKQEERERILDYMNNEIVMLKIALETKDNPFN
jgi:hypothetical protein